MCNDCYLKLKKELEERGCFNLEVDGLNFGESHNTLLIPCTYQIKKTDSEEFLKKPYRTKYIAKYCTNCGKLLNNEKTEEK